MFFSTIIYINNNSRKMFMIHIYYITTWQEHPFSSFSSTAYTQNQISPGSRQGPPKKTKRPCAQNVFHLAQARPLSLVSRNLVHRFFFIFGSNAISSNDFKLILCILGCLHKLQYEIRKPLLDLSPYNKNFDLDKNFITA